MRHIPEWQKVVHLRNVEKGFYDYKADLAAVEHLLDDTYKHAEFQDTRSGYVDVPISLDIYWALARLVRDYRKAMIERKLLLAIGELSEAHEELRAGHEPTETYYNPEKPDKPEGFGIELADAVIRALDIAEDTNVDADACMTLKHEYNGTRPYKHGKAF